MVMVDTNLARQLARNAGLFCRIVDDRLVFYAGKENYQPSWVEAGSTLLECQSGVCLVSRYTVNLIIAGQRAARRGVTATVMEKGVR